MIALGMIETKGLVAAIEAADVMLKSANVYLLERTCVGAGLVTISIASDDVAAVSASVEAASYAVQKMSAGALVSKHVIPRPDLELEAILNLKGRMKKEPTKEKQVEAKVTPPVQKAAVKVEKVQETKVQETKKKHTKEELEAMSLLDLRKLAKAKDKFTLSAKDIANSSKERLIEELLK